MVHPRLRVGRHHRPRSQGPAAQNSSMIGGFKTIRQARRSRCRMRFFSRIPVTGEARTTSVGSSDLKGPAPRVHIKPRLQSEPVATCPAPAFFRHENGGPPNLLLRSAREPLAVVIESTAARHAAPSRHPENRREITDDTTGVPAGRGLGGRSLRSRPLDIVGLVIFTGRARR